ncbi:MAG: YdbL family protein [Methylobacter sp.]|nr:YdbL family protein [Methylobacter sp.]MDP2097593.1 YdbL family protein [Methylobacter sp.]MDP2428496.1 YdbL family protein [Methylobacter sp.]MDP3056240.1 YdbL family protein [Methylobacter sp.]MDP3363771.1 YdbL family protein [Methylobacter sp.]
MKKIAVAITLLLTACVTINIYFPAAAAEKAADEIIRDIQNIAPQKVEPKASLPDWQVTVYQLIDSAINVVIAPAHADGADLTIDSADIRRLRATMEARFPSLQPLYAAGFIGIQADGLLAVRDAGSVPLKDRNQVNKLVAAENADRLALYQAIANANGRPDWAAQIKSTFAARWISNAQRGWWYQSSGSWKQK